MATRAERQAEFDADVDDSSAAVSVPKPISALAAGLKRLSMSLRSSSLGRRSSSRARGEDSTGAANSDAADTATTISTLQALLAVPASELLRPQNSILCLDPSTAVGDALAALAARRVLSAPVRTLEAAGSSSSPPPEGTTKEFIEASRRASAEGRDFLCFVDVRDVLMSFLEVIPEGALDGAKLLKRAKVLEEAGSKLSEMPLSSLPVIGSDGAFLLDSDEGGENEADNGDDEGTKAAAASASAPPLLSSSMPLRELLGRFLVGSSNIGRGNGGKEGCGAVSVVRQGGFPRARAVAHRVALLSPKKAKNGDDNEKKQRVTHIVSQLDAARFVLKHAAALGPLALKTAAELGWAEGKVVTVPATAPAIEALSAMRRAGVAGLAVVESGPSSAAADNNNDGDGGDAAPPSPSPSGAMIGSFAVPDLRALVCEHLGSLALPVGEALAKAKGREFWGVARSGGNGGGEKSGNATPVGSFGGRGGGSSGVAAALASSSSAVGTPTLFGTSPRDASAAAAAARRASIGGRVGQALATASPDDTFSVILARLVARRVHRLHVVDDETSAPLGVVTLTDALACVLAAREKESEGDAKAAAKAALV